MVATPIANEMPLTHHISIAHEDVANETDVCPATLIVFSLITPRTDARFAIEEMPAGVPSAAVMGTHCEDVGVIEVPKRLLNIDDINSVTIVVKCLNC